MSGGAWMNDIPGIQIVIYVIYMTIFSYLIIYQYVINL